MPIAWEEVTPKLAPCAFTLRTVPDHIARTPDPWEDMGKVRQSAAPAIAALAS